MTAPSRARHAEQKHSRPDLTFVRRRRARRSMLTRLGTVMLFSLFVSVLGIVVFQTLRVQNQAKLDEISDRIAEEEGAAKALRLKIADAQSPDRISEAARTRLGMIPPNDIAYLQPSPEDEAKAAWDPQKEPIPLPPPPETPPTTAAPPPTATSGSSTSAGTNITKSSGATAARTTPTTKAATSPSTIAGGTTPSTSKPTTRPTTSRPPATTTTRPTGTRR